MPDAGPTSMLSAVGSDDAMSALSAVTGTSIGGASMLCAGSTAAVGATSAAGSTAAGAVGSCASGMSSCVFAVAESRDNTSTTASTLLGSILLALKSGVTV